MKTVFLFIGSIGFWMLAGILLIGLLLFFVRIYQKRTKKNDWSKVYPELRNDDPPVMKSEEADISKADDSQHSVLDDTVDHSQQQQQQQQQQSSPYVLEETEKRNTIDSKNRQPTILHEEMIDGLQEELTAEEDDVPSPKTTNDSVNFAGFSPSSMEAGNSYIIDIWAFTDLQFDSVKDIAKALDRNNITGYKSGLKIDRGTILSLHLTSLSKDLIVENSMEVMTWEGEKTNASFVISFSDSAKTGKHLVKVRISVAGLSIATLLINLTVSETASNKYQKCDGDFQRINSAFASYSSQNRADVLARLQGIKKINPNMEIFLDILTLRSGDNWKDKLEEHVPSKDKFYLFWSKSAAESVWVEREWKLALEKRGIDYIDPVPLDEPHLAPPPKELSSLHFNDAYMTYIKHYQSQQKNP